MVHGMRWTTLNPPWRHDRARHLPLNSVDAKCYLVSDLSFVRSEGARIVVIDLGTRRESES